MDMESAKKVPLNRITHSVRASQAVLQYGVGAMIDFPNQTLMTAAPEYWQEQVVQIHDERLEKVLRVDYFGLPGGQDDPHCREGISYARFPEWYFCPKCRRFQSISDWVSDYKKSATQKRLNSDPDMVKFMQCPKCRQDLVVTRIITACECGHIDDFPWVKWVHCKNMYGGAKPICAHPALTFKTSASSTEGLEGLTVSCESCGAKATLKGLEADVVILLDVDKTTFEQGNALIFYVGTSRARIKLEIAAILSDDDCKEILMSILNYRGKIRRAQKDLAGALNAIGSLDS